MTFFWEGGIDRFGWFPSENT